MSEQCEPNESFNQPIVVGHLVFWQTHATHTHRQENARQHQRDRQRTQRDVWVQVSHEPEQWTSALAVLQLQPPTGVVLERSVTKEPVGTAEMVEEKEVPQTERGQGVPPCTSMETSHDSEVASMERAQFGQKDDERLDIDGISDHWSPACTHMATSEDDNQLMASGAPTHTHTHTRTHTHTHTNTNTGGAPSAVQLFGRLAVLETHTLRY